VLGEVVSEVLLDRRELLFTFTCAPVSLELLAWLLLRLCKLLDREALLSEGKLFNLTSVGRITTRRVVRVRTMNSRDTVTRR